MRKIIGMTLLLLVCAVTAARAEGSVDSNARYRYMIKGVVTDEEGQPLPGASVKIVGTTFGAGTNTDGEFTLRVEDTKRRTLRVSFMGYEPAEVEATPDKRPAALAIRLKSASNSLNEVVVTGSFVEKPLKDVPVLTRVISQKDIQALNPMSIETLLQYEIPGLQIGYNSMSQLPEITYMGMDGEYILFLIDGERVSGEGADHNVDFTRFNVDDIERVEIIKGSQSTIYGSNALGGVINIITKNADRPFSGSLSARYAGDNGQKYTASTGTKQGKFSSYTSLTWRQKDTYTIGDDEGKSTVTVTPGEGESETVADPASTTVYGYNIWDFSQRLGYTCNEKLSTDLKGTFYHNKRDVRAGHNYQDFFVDYTLSGKVKYLPSENQQLTVSYIFDNYKKDKEYFRTGRVSTDYRNRTQTPRVDYTGTFGDHTVSAGFEGNLEYLKHYFMKDTSSVSAQTYSLYLQEDWRITEELNVVAGVRADYHKKYHLHVTPKLSVLYRICDLITLRAGYSQGFRSPSLKELYQEYDMGGLGIMMLYGNPDLKPETSHQYSLSAEFTKGGFNMSVSATHNRFKNKITLLSLDDGTNDSRYENAEEAKTTGVETILRYRWNFGLTLTGSYAYTKDYEEVNGLNTSSVRPHTATFNAMFSRKFKDIGVNCSLNGQWACAHDRYSIDSETGAYRVVSYDPRTMCSLNAGVSLPRGVSLNFGVDNLFNYKDKAADSSLQVPQKGISYVGTVTVNIADMFKL